MEGNHQYTKFKELLPEYISDCKQQQFMKDMFELVTTNRDTSKVTCVSARCGTGKSVFTNTYIRYLTEKNNNCDMPIGIVVVTDSIKRLSELANVEDDGKQIISLNSDEPLKDQMIKQYYKPIVLLSTQRYARLSEEMREQLFYFNYNGQKYRRNTVIFDEKPYFFEIISIGMKNINDIQTALYNGLSDQVEDKEFILSDFKILKERLTYVMDTMEHREVNKNVTLYWYDRNIQKLTSNDELFFKVLNENQEPLIRQYNNIFRDLDSIKQLIQQGGIFNSIKKRNGNYEKNFYIIKDNSDSFYINQDIKFFVFDSGADISPEYDLPYVEILNCNKYAGNINLEIVNVNISSSKNTICRKDNSGNDYLQAINKYIRNQIESRSIDNNVLFLTYSDLVKIFQREYSHVAYFGNLRGWNEYKDYKFLFHIGLNRFPNLTYFLLYCGTHPKEYAKLANMPQNKSIKFFEDLNTGASKYKDAIADIMIHSLLSDFEQNIFRIAIRKPDNEEKVTVWTFYNNGSEIYKRLSNSIEQRYKRFGATFIYEGKPMEWAIEKAQGRKAPNGRGRTNAQIFIDWYMQQSSGRKIKMQDIISETGLKKSSIDELRKSSPSVKQILQRMKTAERGWYQIPA